MKLLFATLCIIMLASLAYDNYDTVEYTNQLPEQNLFETPNRTSSSY